MSTSDGTARRRHGLIAAATAVATAFGLVAGVSITTSSTASIAAADTAPPAGLPATVTADPLPAPQINGVVWAQATVANTVYATGVFNTVRPAGAKPNTQTSPVADILAYDITTGKLITSFKHTLNGAGLSMAVSPDHKRVYVGGDFTTVDGVAHNHLVAFLTATGAVDTSFTPKVGSSVQAIAASSSAVYVGGSFVTAGTAGSTNLPRANLAAFDTAGHITNWAPTANRSVHSLVVSPDGSRVIVGGAFWVFDGTSAYGSASVSATDGTKVMPWAMNTRVFDASGSQSDFIDGLTTDGKLIYGAGVDADGLAGADFEGRFAADPNTGAIVWSDNCYGDSYDTLPIGQVLYSVSHDHNCVAVGGFSDGLLPYEPWHRTMAETTFPSGGVNGPGGRTGVWSLPDGLPSGQVLDWFPILSPAPRTLAGAPAGTIAVSGAAESGWSLTGNADYISVGGEFTQAGGAGQQGLVRYAVHTIAPNKQGPVTEAGLATPTASVTPAGVSLAWTGSWDRDNQMLTYQVYRDGSSTPIYSTTTPSLFWQEARMNFTDTGVSAGTHTYKLKTSDPNGNVIAASVTVKLAAAIPAAAKSTDLALNKPTAASSLYASTFYEPGRAVDGNTNGAAAAGSMAITNIAQNSWWQVDLGSSQAVGSINVYGRTENASVAPQSAAYDVFVSNKPFDQRLNPAQQATQPGVLTFTQPTYPGAEKTFTLPSGTTARYVLIQHTTDNYLSLADVQVFAPPAPTLPDLALNRPASQSSTALGAVAARAVDGNTNGVFTANSVTSTNATVDPWWQVNLGATKLINTVTVSARSDCCNTNLSSYWIFLSNKPINTSLTPAQQSKVAGVYARHVTSAPKFSTVNTFPKGASAWYVMIQLDSPTALPLQLAEVQISS